MRYFLVGLLVLLMSSAAFAQKKTKTDPEYMVYKKAMDYGDLPVARTAVMQLMVKYPEKPQWKDTLIAIYGAMGMYEQAILLGEEILQTRPNDTNSLQIVAISYEGLNVLNKAIEYYEKVLVLRNNLFLRYKLAVCQYGLKRNPESMSNVDKIISDKSAADQKITITYESGSQEVPLVAAALNLGGIILIDERKYEDAKLYFESALKMDQTFALAQNNLQVVTGLLEKGK
jgi:tetratricopeptide (TPR) repeat protein